MSKRLNRRQFMRTTAGAAAAGSSLLTALLRARAAPALPTVRNPNEKLQLAVVGLGGISTGHLVSAAEKEALVAVCDVRHATIARKLEQVGAATGQGSERDMAWLSLRSLVEPEQLDPAVEVLTQMLAKPDFPQQDFAREQARTLVALEVAKCTASRSSNLEIVGALGQLWVDYQRDEVVLLERHERTVLRQAGPVMTLPRMLGDFAQHLERGQPMPITAQDGVRTLEVVEACYRSLAENRPEPVSRPHLVEPPLQSR